MRLSEGAPNPSCQLFVSTERALELETNLKSLQTQLKEQENNTSEIVSRWQESCAAAEEKCALLQVELGKAIEVKDALQASAKKVPEQPSPETFVLMLQEKDDEIQRNLQEIERIQMSEATLRGECSVLSILSLVLSNAILPTSSTVSCLFLRTSLST